MPVVEKLIDIIKKTISNTKDFMPALEKNSDLCWQAAYPVAVVHSQNRVKEPEILAAMKEKNLIDEDGFTPQSWSAERIDELKSIAPRYLKSVSILVHQGDPHTSFLFQEKRAGDYWKKISDDGSFVATLEYSQYGPGTDICRIETDLRNLMRSSKEVPSLKEIGYIWVVEAPMELELDMVLTQYYQKNWLMVVAQGRVVYIGWHERLGSVDMKRFVCPPMTKRSESV